jgi:hypothetical protein
MDSFWLAETLKYLYLTFADDSHWLHVRPSRVQHRGARVSRTTSLLRTRAASLGCCPIGLLSVPLAAVNGGERSLAGARPGCRCRDRAAARHRRRCATRLVEGGDVPMSAWTIVDIPSPSGGSPISFRASTAQFGPPLDAAGVCGALKWMTAIGRLQARVWHDVAQRLRRGGGARRLLVCGQGGARVGRRRRGADSWSTTATRTRRSSWRRSSARTRSRAPLVRMPTVLVPRQAGVQMLHLLNT